MSMSDDDIPEHWWHANNDVSHLARIVTEQYQSLRSLIMATQGDIDALTAQVTSALTDINTQVSNLGTDVTNIQTEITTLEGQVSTGTVDLTGLQSAAAQLATTQSNLDAAVSSVGKLVPPATTPPASGTGATPSA
jgi:cob(I)alamin adenosyltransferase